MKRLGNVYPRITEFGNLHRATLAAAHGKRCKASVREFLFGLEYELVALQRELEHGNYRPGRYHQFVLYDPKERTISVAPFRDRVVHHAVCRVIEPWLERRFIYDSYACRKDKGQHKAMARAQQFARRFRYLLKCDVRKFFDSIDLSLLKRLLACRFKDQRLLSLLSTIIDHGPNADAGLPIGNLTSQHFANLYLDQLDHFVKQELRIRGYLRYMDDFALFADDKATLHRARGEIVEFLRQRLNLELKDSGTYLRPCWQGFPFLGFRVFPGLIKIQRSGWRRFKRKFLQRQQQYLDGDLDFDRFVGSIAGLVGHVARADTWNLRRQFFARHAMDL